MDPERSVFNITEPKKLYALGMAVSFMIHISLALAVVTLPRFVQSKRFSDTKAYRVKMVSAEQIGKLPQVGVKAPSVADILSKTGESKGNKGDIPVYSVKKVNVTVEEGAVQKTELRPIDSPPSAPSPKPSQQSLPKWETLLPNIGFKKDVKPIEQRKDFLKEDEDTKTGKTETTPSRSNERKGGQGGSDSGETRQETQQAAGSNKGQDREGKGGAERGGSSQSSEEYGLARKLYYSEVWKSIQSQWAVPVELLNRDDLEAIVIIKIRRDGTIMDMRFEKKSGNDIFDTSVLRAIQKANPLPPFPKTYSPPYEEIGIRFRPKDLKKG